MYTARPDFGPNSRTLDFGASRAVNKTNGLFDRVEKPGETLESFSTRTQNIWSVEEIAVANGLVLDAVLPAGALVKIAVLEPHPTQGD